MWDVVLSALYWFAFLDIFFIYLSFGSAYDCARVENNQISLKRKPRFSHARYKKCSFTLQDS